MNIDYRDRTKALTAEDIIRRYDLDGLSKDRKVIQTLNDGLTKTDTIMKDFIENTSKYVQDQVDNNVTTWFFSGVPTLENKPFVDFRELEKASKVDDFYYDRNTGFIYQLKHDEELYYWQILDDDYLRESMAIASSSADTSDNKRNIFYGIPVPPYQVGDIWADLELKRCRCSRNEGEYHETDWVLQKDYSDSSVLLDTQAVLNQFQETVETSYATKVQLETTKESIEAKVESNTTEIRNNEVAINDKLNNYALVETVTEQIDSVESKINSNGMEIKVLRETVENGATKVKTEKGYLFDDEGLKIDDSSSKVKNTLDETGMAITDKSDQSILLFAGYDKELQETVVKSKNMIVEKYFSIPHARFEMYTNPKFGEGTGCFYI